ncbi:hypothetical protein SESBI_27258 [Sesbania bispinosa]|nr:hypothetical protein SESBI_27258 [Sesbania bispinosa]
MSKKNNLAKRKKQHEFDLRSTLLPSISPPIQIHVSMVDGSDKKKKGGSGFQVGKRKLKTKMTALAKAKAAQAMELDK